MNLFKQEPEKIFQIVAAVVTALLAFYLVIFFNTRSNVYDSAPISSKKESSVSEEKKLDPNAFGAVHVSLAAPSFARSNFDIDPNTDITVYFNEKVNKDSLEGKVVLTNLSTLETVPLTIGEAVEREDTDSGEEYVWQWQEKWKEAIVFKPSGALAAQTRYKLTIKAGFSTFEDEYKTSPKIFSYEFITTAEPGVEKTNLNQENILPAEDFLRIDFKSPMSKESVLEQVSIEPFNDSIKFDLFDKSLFITGFLNNTDYAVYVPEDLTDLYGRNMPNSTVLNFSIR